MINAQDAIYKVMKFSLEEGALVGLVCDEEIDSSTLPSSGFEVYEIEKNIACPDAFGSIVRTNSDPSRFGGSIIFGKIISLGPDFKLTIIPSDYTDTGKTCTVNDLKVYSIYCRKCAEQDKKPADFPTFFQMREDAANKNG